MKKGYLNKYERATAAIEEYFATHTAEEIVADFKKNAPYAFRNERQPKKVRRASKKK